MISRATADKDRRAALRAGLIKRSVMTTIWSSGPVADKPPTR